MRQARRSVYVHVSLRWYLGRNLGGTHWSYRPFLGEALVIHGDEEAGNECRKS